VNDENTDRFIKEAADLMKAVPKRRPSEAKEVKVPDNWVFCACKKKMMPKSDVRYFSTSVTQKYAQAAGLPVKLVKDELCKECHAMSTDMCLLICIRCCEVVSRFAPWKDPKTGFEYKKGHAYHIAKCPSCAKEDENLEGQMILEFAAFLRDNLKKKDI
jgi:hypothetical protein